MNSSPPRTRVLLGLAFALLLGTVVTRADVSGVRDHAGFFSETAKTTAGRTISDIEKNLKKDVLIETFAEVPADVKKGIDLADKAAVGAMFEKWTLQQARQLKVNGVYVLLTKEPAHLQVIVGNETQKQAFTQADRATLVSTMLAKLRAKQNDDALLDGVNFVQATMRSHVVVRGPVRSNVGVPQSAPPMRVPEAASESSRPMWMWVLLALIGVGVILFIMGLIRAMTRSNNSTPGMPPQLGGGGGGFMSSLLGGMFGAAAGMWLYDQFSGNHGNAFGSDRSNDSNSGGDDGFSRRDTDYSSSGSDFGDSSGGGGGDSGGGGGDSGGGGGGDF